MEYYGTPRTAYVSLEVGSIEEYRGVLGAGTDGGTLKLVTENVAYFLAQGTWRDAAVQVEDE